MLQLFVPVTLQQELKTVQLAQAEIQAPQHIGKRIVDLVRYARSQGAE